jgi:hypothetical protein
MQPFKLLPEESLLVNDPHVTWMLGGSLNVDGQLKLTNQRLVFVKNGNEIAGPLKWFVKSLREHILLEFPLGEIKNYVVLELGKNKRLTIDNGVERPREFEVSKLAVLDAELKKRVKKSGES